MFETGVRQLRMGLSMSFGRRINPRNVCRLVDDLLDTIEEFGLPAEDVQQVLHGQRPDEQLRKEIANQALRRTARRLAAQSPFYARRFEAAKVDLGKLDVEGMRAIPVTVKRDLRERPADFRCTGVPAYLATRTTGTTGNPTEIWLSRYETELWPALAALALVIRGELCQGDILQSNFSSRATLAVHLAVASTRIARVGCRPLGLVPPDEALDAITSDAVTSLLTYPSYLAELVIAARRRGLGPDDFRLRNVFAGSEVLSPSLTQAAKVTFGVPSIANGYSITEATPVDGTECSQGHLHHEGTVGLTEVLDLVTAEPAEPGALGTLVITPFFPYRDCMPVFRYDTRDVVRRLPEGPLTCESADIPATGEILGKADHLLDLGTGEVVTPRQLIEAIEALPTMPWPARYRAVAQDGQVRLTLPQAAIDGYGEAAAVRHFADEGLRVDLDIVPDDQAGELRRVRSDLHETTFANQPALVGA